MRFTLISAIAIVLFACTGCAGAAKSDLPTAEAGKGFGRIALYAGTWKAESEEFDTAYSKAGKSSKTIRNECWTRDGFFACVQNIDGVSKVLVVFTYDKTQDIYHSYAIPVDGEKASPGGTLVIKGNVWTYPSEYQVKDKTVHLRVINVITSPTIIDFRREYSEDGINWTTMSTGHEVKIGPGD